MVRTSSVSRSSVVPEPLIDAMPEKLTLPPTPVPSFNCVVATPTAPFPSSVLTRKYVPTGRSLAERPASSPTNLSAPVPAITSSDDAVFTTASVIVSSPTPVLINVVAPSATTWSAPVPVKNAVKPEMRDRPVASPFDASIVMSADCDE